MSDPRKIEIELAAKGGDEAAEEIRKVGTEIDEAAKSAEPAKDGIGKIGEVIEDVGRKAPETTKAIERQADAVRELTDAEKEYQERKEAFEARRASGAFDKGAPAAESTRGFGGMLDTSPERAEEAAAAVEKMADAQGKAADAAEDLGNKSEEARPKVENLDEKVSEIARIQKAMVVTELAKGFAMLGEQVRAAGDRFEESDPKFASTLHGVADGLDTMSSAAAGAAQGLAVGGPFGAAVGTLVGALLPELKSSFQEAADSLEALAKSEADAAALIESNQAKINRAYSMGLENWRAAVEESENYRDVTDKLTDSIDQQARALEKRNRILDAKEAADAAERDVADAAAIRGGEAPEDVAARRARDDAEIEKARIARELEQKRAAQIAAADELLNANKGLELAMSNPDQMRKDGQTAEQLIEEMKKEVARAKAEFDQAQASFETARDIAPQQIRAVDARAAGKIADADFDKQARLDKEREAAEREARREADRSARESAAAERARLQEQIEDAEESRDQKARDSGLRIRDTGNRTGNRLLSQLGGMLQDGTNEAEIQKAADMVRENKGKLGGAMVAALMEVAEELEEAQRQITNLRGQLKKSRDLR